MATTRNDLVSLCRPRRVASDNKRAAEPAGVDGYRGFARLDFSYRVRRKHSRPGNLRRNVLIALLSAAGDEREARRWKKRKRPRESAINEKRSVEDSVSVRNV